MRHGRSVEQQFRDQPKRKAPRIPRDQDFRLNGDSVVYGLALGVLFWIAIAGYMGWL
jgi:hypothetical protein